MQPSQITIPPLKTLMLLSDGYRLNTPDLNRLTISDLVNKRSEIEAWLADTWQSVPKPLYYSVDLRNNFTKLAPIDTNLFPAGFNNLNINLSQQQAQVLGATINENHGAIKRILLIPENHTDNPFYFANIHRLCQLLKMAGYELRIGSLIDLDRTSVTVTSNEDQILTLHRLSKTDKEIHVEEWVPELVLLNNDLSSGIPPLLTNINQPIHPSPALGWQSRLKSIHFNHYQKLCESLGEALDIDPWMLNPISKNCGQVDFMKNEGIDCLTSQAEELLGLIKQKYAEYEIQEQPYIVVKTDAGTYGMGVMMITDPAQLQQLNRKQRRKMSKSKGGQPITKVIIQEGVHSLEKTTDNQVAEPVIYMSGQHALGGFYRIHPEKGQGDNLNAPGMHFQPMEIAESDREAESFYLYTTVASLAGLAAAREFLELQDR